MFFDNCFWPLLHLYRHIGMCNFRMCTGTLDCASVKEISPQLLSWMRNTEFLRINDNSQMFFYQKKNRPKICLSKHGFKASFKTCFECEKHRNHKSRTKTSQIYHVQAQKPHENLTQTSQKPHAKPIWKQDKHRNLTNISHAITKTSRKPHTI